MNERSARGERDHLGRVLPVLKIRYRDRPRYFFWQLFFFDDVGLNQEKKAMENPRAFYGQCTDLSIRFEPLHVY
jgi:hypothetical protein